MGLISSLASAKAAPFKLPSLAASLGGVSPSVSPFAASAFAIPGGYPQLTSENGQGGGSGPNDTGAKPTAAQTGTADKVGTGYGTPGSDPNYDTLLKGDSILGSGLAGLGIDYAGNLTGSGQAAILQSQLTNARKAALENYGGVPSFSDSANASAGYSPADIDATTRQLASENTGSVLSQLSRQYATANESAQANLAARGMLRSGSLGQHELENLGNYNQSSYDAGQNLLNYLGGLWGNYQTGLGGLQSSRTDLINQSLQRIIAQINAGLIGRTPATPPTPSDDPSPTLTDTLNAQLAPLATSGVSAYSPSYVGSDYIPAQPITPTNFYTDVSLGAQSQTAAAANNAAAPYVGVTGMSGYNQKSKANLH